VERRRVAQLDIRALDPNTSSGSGHFSKTQFHFVTGYTPARRRTRVKGLGFRV